MARLFICLLFLLRPAYSVAAQGVDVRFVTEHWPPYNYVNKDGQLDGIAYHKLKKVVNDLNWRAEFKLFHWAKSLAQTEQSTNTFLFSIYPTPERRKKFQLICPLTKIKPIAFYKLTNRNDVVLNTKQDAKKYITGVIREGLAIQSLKNAGFIENKHLYVSLDDVTSLQQLINRRIDLIVDEENALAFRLKQLNAKDIQLTRLLPLEHEAPTQLCIATHHNTDKRLVNALKEALQ